MEKHIQQIVEENMPGDIITVNGMDFFILDICTQKVAEMMVGYNPDVWRMLEMFDSGWSLQVLANDTINEDFFEIWVDLHGNYGLPEKINR